MCGIVGFSGHVKEGQWGETHRLLESLLLAAEHRGRDATGFFAVTQPFKGDRKPSMAWDKWPHSAKSFVQQSGAWRRLRHQRCNTVVGHVRWATHGSPARNRNNHPFISLDGRYYLVHNGVVSNHRHLANQYAVDLHTECDSEVLLRLIERHADPAQGLATALDRIHGSMAAVVYDRRQECLWLARDGDRPLWLLRLVNDRRWFFASTRAILVEACAAEMGKSFLRKVEIFIPLPQGHVTVLQGDGSWAALEMGRSITLK